MMFFHGAEREQFESYRGRGIDMSVGPGSHANDDVGAGLYVSQDYESARLYAAGGGSVVPFIARRSDLGHVIDIRPGSPLRARWEAFFSANFGRPGFGEAFAAAMLRPGGFRLGSGEPLPIGPGGFGLFTTEKAGRGLLMAEFLVELSMDSSLPQSVRAAALEPHMIMTDLGGPGTHGTDRGFITDQAAFKTQAIADLINQQMGFGRFSAANDNEPAPRMRSVVAAPERPADATTRLTSALLGDNAGGPRDVEGHLSELMRLAPQSTTEFFTEVARAGASGRVVRPSEEILTRLTSELTSHGVPADVVETMRTRFDALADPEHPVYLRVSEAGAQSRFNHGLGDQLQRAFERRAALDAADRYAYHGASSEERQAVRNAYRTDREALARLITGRGTERERAIAYARARVLNGANLVHALGEGMALVRAVDSSDFGTVRARVENELRQINQPNSLAEMVRQQPEALLYVAHTNPEELAQFYVDLVFKNIAEGVTTSIDAQRFAQYVGNRIRGNLLPVASEISLVFSLKKMGIEVLKSDAAQRGSANRPGLDVVGFSRLNGVEVPPGPVNVFIADDKAYRMSDPFGIHQIQDVSAMMGPRLVENLRSTLQEI